MNHMVTKGIFVFKIPSNVCDLFRYIYKICEIQIIHVENFAALTIYNVDNIQFFCVLWGDPINTPLTMCTYVCHGID